MNLAVGTLVFAGLASILLGVISEVMGLSLLSPFIANTTSYFILATTCLVLALVIDRFETR
ncbi:MAG: hypothetical protein KJ687_09605 [Proteobacteria bacterium]|nr:hypothetical protein [Pseudomonadota bacterium]